LRENGSISAFLCPQPIGLPDPLSPVQESAGPLAGILRGKNVGTPYGTFHLDLTERMEIEEAASA